MTALDVAMDLARRGVTAGVIMCDDGAWTTHTDPTAVHTVSARTCQLLNASALDDVARQVPGLVWQLTFASDDADRFMLGLLCRGGGSASGLLEPLLP